jgi:hypothetical protein
MKRLLLIATLFALTSGCGGARQTAAPPEPTTRPAPVLVGYKVMLLPTQRGPVPVADAQMQHFPLDGAKLDAEIAYWVPQLAGAVNWVLPNTIQRAIDRSPTLGVDMKNLPVSSFQRAQVKRIGDPLFGDLRRLAAVLDARIAVVPVAAELIGPTRAEARAQVATAVIDTFDGTVLWYGVLEGDAGTQGDDAALASAAQAFARAFAGKRN